MTNLQPEPGWYPRPDGAAGQVYWDGQRWQPRGPATAPAPWEAMKPQLEKARPYVDQGRRIWSDQPRDRKRIVIGVAALGVVMVIVIAAAAFMFLFGDDSASYEAGRKRGELPTTHLSALMSTPEAACQEAFQSSQAGGSSYDEDAYIKGCLEAFNDDIDPITGEPN